MLLCFKSLWSRGPTHESADSTPLDASIERLASAFSSAPEESSARARETMLHFLATGIGDGCSLFLLPYVSRMLKDVLATVTNPDRVCIYSLCCNL